MTRGVVQQHISQCLAHAQDRISWLIALEDRPFTLNTHYLSDYRTKFFAHYKGSRQSDQNTELMRAVQSYSPQAITTVYGTQPTGIAKVIAGLAEMGMTGIRPEDLPKLLPSDKMEPALAIMADVRAYFQGKFIYSLFYYRT